MDYSDESLCRICLKDGAKIPIFESQENRNISIQAKLALCVSEKIEDVNGYPRNICKFCCIELDHAYKFINVYKDSCKVLETGLQMVVKQEFVDLNDCNNKQFEIRNIKTEPEVDFDDDTHMVELLSPLELKIESKNKENKKIRPRKKIQNVLLSKNKTNKIASSILEGNFIWNGEKWCLKSKTSLPSIKKEIEKHVRPIGRRDTRIKIPKVKKPTEPQIRLCDLCGQVFKTQERLTLHKNKVHLQNPVRCQTCFKICASNYYLNRHIKRKHTQELDYVCSACGRRFAFKGELTTHYKKVHDKHSQPKKKFACKLCNKVYACAKSVLIHERSVHTGERPAVCTVCGTSFFHEDYLKEHMRLHTGETPFKCPVCGRGYAQRCNMKSHIRIHRISDLDPVLLSKIRPNYLRLMKV